MRSKLLLLLMVCLLCAGMSYSATLVINASGMSFSPNTGSISLGDTVIFQWVDGSHTTTSTSVPSGAATWDNPLNASSPAFMYIPTVAGDYSYKCIPHEAMGMTGTFTVHAPTGIEHIDQQSAIKIYPNPAQSELSIAFPEKISGTYSITDISGKKLIDGQIQLSNTGHIDLSALPNGVYLLNFHTGSTMFVKKFTITR